MDEMWITMCNNQRQVQANSLELRDVDLPEGIQSIMFAHSVLCRVENFKHQVQGDEN